MKAWLRDVIQKIGEERKALASLAMLVSWEIWKEGMHVFFKIRHQLQRLVTFLYLPWLWARAWFVKLLRTSFLISKNGKSFCLVSYKK
jgi:hypothetical protein